MLINNIKTSSDLSYAEPADMITIKSEVKQHDFYSAFCMNIMPNIVEHDVMISYIQHMAARAQLQVTFNAEETICIFEAY